MKTDFRRATLFSVVVFDDPHSKGSLTGGRLLLIFKPEPRDHRRNGQKPGAHLRRAP